MAECVDRAANVILFGAGDIGAGRREEAGDAFPLDQRMPPPRKERLAAIDALRGIAALSVVLYHFVGFIPLMAIPVGAVGDMVVAVTRYGHLGVEVSLS